MRDGEVVGEVISLLHCVVQWERSLKQRYNRGMGYNSDITMGRKQ